MENRLAYRVLTGPDDRLLRAGECGTGRRLPAARPPAMTHDGERVIVAQASSCRVPDGPASYAGDVSPRGLCRAPGDATRCSSTCAPARSGPTSGCPTCPRSAAGDRAVEWQRFPDGARQRAVRRRAPGRRADPGRPGLLPLPLRRPLGRRRRGRDRRGPRARRTTCSRASRGRTTSRATAPSPAGRTPACRGGRDERWTRRAGPDTLAVRGGLARSSFEETAEALFLTSGFVYDTAEQAEAAFTGEVEHFVYSRYGNPTVATFEERLRLLEGAEACFATASGMSAVFVALAALLGQGDRVVALAGAVRLVLRHPRRDPAALGRRDGLRRRPRPRPVARGAVRADARRCSSRRRATRCRSSSTSRRSASWRTPPARRSSSTTSSARRCSPSRCELGADVVVYSATKHIDGQGRALGGAVLGTKEFIDGPVKNLMRHTGPALSPFNAWVLLKGLETLSLRVEKQAASALARGPRRSRRSPAVAGSCTPGWSRTRSTSWPRRQMMRRRHRRHLRARRRQGRGLRAAERAAGHRHLQQPRRRQVADHPPGHHDAPPAGRPRRGPRSGITDGAVRLSVGLEDVRDLIDDLRRGPGRP